MSQATEQIARQFANANANKVNWNGVMLNVKTYGAVGDGVADDTQAFRAAIDYMSAHTDIKTLYLPTGNYLITDSVDIGLHKITIKGENAQTYIAFKPPTPRDCFFASGTVVNQLRIDGLNFLDGTASGFLTSGAFIHLSDSSQCTIENCTFSNGNIGVWAERGFILGIHRNYFQGQKIGIRFESNVSTSKIVDVSITQNYIRDCTTCGIQGLEYSEGLFIRGNTLYLNKVNISLVASIPLILFSVKIQENDIDSGTNKGLEMVRVTNFQLTDNWCATSENYSFHLDLCGSGMIVGNLFYPKVTVAQTNFGINLEGCNLITATGNTIGGGDGGIRIDKTNLVATTACKGINFTGNTVADSPLGVHLYNNAPVSKGVNVVANIFQNVTTPVGDGGTLNLVNVNNNSYV